MNEKPKKYDVVAVIWEDHLKVHRQELPKNSDDLLDPPILSVGILVDKTRKTITLASDIEKKPTGTEATYLVILRNAVVAMETYGQIELDI